MRSGRAAGLVRFCPHRAEDGCIDLHTPHTPRMMVVVSVHAHDDHYSTRDAFGAHATACPQLQSYRPLHGQRRGFYTGEGMRVVSTVLDSSTRSCESLHTPLTTGSNIALCGASMAGHFMCIAQGARDQPTTSRSARSRLWGGPR